MQTERRPASEIDSKFDDLRSFVERRDTPKRPLRDRKYPQRSSPAADSGLLRELREAPGHLD